MVVQETDDLESKVAGLTIDADHDSLNLEQKTKLCNIERHKSCGVSQTILSWVKHDGCQSRNQPPTLEANKCGDTPRGSCVSWAESTADTSALHKHPMADAAWDALKKSIVYFRGQPIGTVAAIDKSQTELNYDQVFMRDFVPSALAFLMKGEPLIVKNFLLETSQMVDLFKLGQGVMPASFKVHHSHSTDKTETMVADFGEIAIGRGAPVDSGLWWIFLLHAYTKYTRDNSLAESPHCQRAMRLILKLWLSEGFDTSPALLCSDGCSMIDRRMGIYGYPIEIQALFFMALRCASSLLKDSDDGFLYQISKRIKALSYHLHSYYWLDFQRLSDIYRYKTEKYSQTALNKFNVIPESIPDWIFDFMPSRGGYFIGNVSPARMDFRWFCLGNFIAILSSLATGEQVEAIMDLVEARWAELIGDMPLKICYPAMENQEWQIVTGCDPKNTRWSYHNGGSWPVLLWLLVAVSLKVGRPYMARRAVKLMEERLSKHEFPEYYDGRAGRYVGKQAHKSQTWSVASYLVAKMLLDDPSKLRAVCLEDDTHTLEEVQLPSTSDGEIDNMLQMLRNIDESDEGLMGTSPPPGACKQIELHWCEGPTGSSFTKGKKDISYGQWYEESSARPGGLMQIELEGEPGRNVHRGLPIDGWPLLIADWEEFEWLEAELENLLPQQQENADPEPQYDPNIDATLYPIITDPNYISSWDD